MTNRLLNLAKQINALTYEELEYIDEVFKKKDNFSVNVSCTNKINDLSQRINEAKKLFLKNKKSRSNELNFGS